jgi:PAS domain S-box-containing protein
VDDQATIAALREEIAALQQEVQELRSHEQEIHRLEERLQESELHHRSLLMNTMHGVAYHQVVLDDHGTPIDYIFLEVNDSFERLTSLKREDIINRRVTEALPGIENDPFDWISFYGKVALTGESATFQQYSQPLERWYTVSVYSPKYGYFVALFYDTTEEKQMERDLQRSQEIINIALDVTQDGLWDWNIQTDEVYFSPTWQTMLGYEVGEIEPKPSAWENLLHPDDKDRAISILNDHFAGHIDYYEVEQRLRTKEGNWKWILARARIIEWDDAGKPLRMVGTHVDISQRRKEEQELHIFRTLVEYAPDAIVVINPDKTLQFANQAFRTMMGFGDEPVEEINVASYHAEEEQERIDHIAAQTIEVGSWRGVITYRKKDGTTFPGQAVLFSIRDSIGNLLFFAGIIHDVTEQQRAEQERIALQQEVIRVQRTAIQELSTPLIPLSENLVLMPLVGGMDTQRAQQVVEILLEGIAAHSAEVAILDVTGVSVIDTQIANTLIHATQAAKLLGTTVILSGIGPSMAQTLVHLGTDLGGVRTYGNLQTAIAHTLGVHQRTRAPS